MGKGRKKTISSNEQKRVFQNIYNKSTDNMKLVLKA